MKKFFKGFTLIECLIALAILGIGTLVMAEIYANVSRINLNNHMVNTSLSYQMKLVEEETGTDSIPIYYGNVTTNSPDSHSVSNSGDGDPPSVASDVSVQKNYVELTKKQSASALSTDKYSFPVDIYVLLSRDANNKASDDPNYTGKSEKDYALRYKYLMGHAN